MAQTYSTLPTTIQVRLLDDIPGFTHRSTPGCGEHSSSRRVILSTIARLMFVVNERAAAVAASSRSSITPAIAVGFGIVDICCQEPAVAVSRRDQNGPYFPLLVFSPMRPPRRCSVCWVGLRTRRRWLGSAQGEVVLACVVARIWVRFLKRTRMDRAVGSRD